VVKVVYFTFRGLFADNPRAVYEALLDRGPAALTHTWLCTPRTQSSFPRGVDTVLYGTPEAAAVLATADVVIANDCMSMEWEKRPGATYLQTWHGTPLKLIGFDNPRWRDNPGFSRVSRDYRKWDYLVTQNAFSSEVFRRAFRFEGEILEEGYPRNDLLLRPDAGEIRERVRARLGLDRDVKVVLYAPTWRDNLVDEHGRSGFSIQLDLDGMLEALGPDYAVLVRMHHQVDLRRAPSRGVVDVSDEPDIRELYLAADMLLTDYSSAMFDFAVTGKPIYYFVYDLEEYRDETRGFYFELAEQAPGPLCRTTAEVVDALADSTAVMTSHAGSYRAFQERYCSLDDGQAAKRILRRVGLGELSG